MTKKCVCLKFFLSLPFRAIENQQFEQFFGGKKVLGFHYENFPLSDFLKSHHEISTHKFKVSVKKQIPLIFFEHLHFKNFLFDGKKILGFHNANLNCSHFSNVFIKYSQKQDVTFKRKLYIYFLLQSISNLIIFFWLARKFQGFNMKISLFQVFKECFH